MRSRQATKFSVIVVGSQAVISIPLDIEGLQVGAESVVASEQVLRDLKTKSNVELAPTISQRKSYLAIVVRIGRQFRLGVKSS